MTASRDPVPPHSPRALTEEETALLLARDIPAHVATLDAAGYPRITLEQVQMTRPDGSPVLDEDGQPIMVRRYSDTLLIALARAHCPESARRGASR